MARKTYHYPPEKNYTHISQYCRNNNCVFGWIDHFDENEVYITTTVCAVCKPDTYDHIAMFPNVGERPIQVLNAMYERRQKGARKSDF